VQPCIVGFAKLTKYRIANEKVQETELRGKGKDLYLEAGGEIEQVYGWITGPRGVEYWKGIRAMQ
jgi:hypothetical protein